MHQQHPNRDAEIVLAMGNFRNMDLRVLYFVAQKAALLLHEFLLACRELDDAIGVSDRLPITSIRKWQERRPYQYITSERLQDEWADGMETFTAAYKSGTLSYEKYAAWQTRIIKGGIRLENSNTAMRKRFQTCLDEALRMKDMDEIQIPTDLWYAMQQRCSIVIGGFQALDRILNDELERKAQEESVDMEADQDMKTLNRWFWPSVG